MTKETEFSELYECPGNIDNCARCNMPQGVSDMVDGLCRKCSEEVEEEK